VIARLIEVYPEDPETHRMLAEIYTRTGRVDEAAEKYPIY